MRFRKSTHAIYLTSNEILMPIVALERTNMGNHPEKLIQVIRKSNSTETGKEKLSSLSFDGWIDISPDAMERLVK